MNDDIVGRLMARILRLEADLTVAADVAVQRGYRIDELERWQTVDLENYKRHLAELEAEVAALRARLEAAT